MVESRILLQLAEMTIKPCRADNIELSTFSLPFFLSNLLESIPEIHTLKELAGA